MRISTRSSETTQVDNIPSHMTGANIYLKEFTILPGVFFALSYAQFTVWGQQSGDKKLCFQGATNVQFHTLGGVHGISVCNCLLYTFYTYLIMMADRLKELVYQTVGQEKGVGGVGEKLRNFPRQSTKVQRTRKMVYLPNATPVVRKRCLKIFQAPVRNSCSESEGILRLRK